MEVAGEGPGRHGAGGAYGVGRNVQHHGMFGAAATWEGVGSMSGISANYGGDDGSFVHSAGYVDGGRGVEELERLAKVDSAVYANYRQLPGSIGKDVRFVGKVKSVGPADPSGQWCSLLLTSSDGFEVRCQVEKAALQPNWTVVEIVAKVQTDLTLQQTGYLTGFTDATDLSYCDLVMNLMHHPAVVEGPT